MGKKSPKVSPLALPISSFTAELHFFSWLNHTLFHHVAIRFHHVSSCFTIFPPSFIMFRHVATMFIMFHHVSSCFVMFHHFSTKFHHVSPCFHQVSSCFHQVSSCFIMFHHFSTKFHHVSTSFHHVSTMCPPCFMLRASPAILVPLSRSFQNHRKPVADLVLDEVPPFGARGMVPMFGGKLNDNLLKHGKTMGKKHCFFFVGQIRVSIDSVFAGILTVRSIYIYICIYIGKLMIIHDNSSIGIGGK